MIFVVVVFFILLWKASFRKKIFLSRVRAVRVKDETSLQNGTWHGLWNDIIARNVIYAE